jgi:glutamate-1-semialdehyde aminotransferase
VLLIFDEVITGFRHALAGKAAYMDRFGPGGGVMFAGIYNGHRVGVSAALATLAILQNGAVHQHTFQLAQRATNGIQQIADELGIPMKVVVFGSVFVPYLWKGRSRLTPTCCATTTPTMFGFARPCASMIYS